MSIMLDVVDNMGREERLRCLFHEVYLGASLVEVCKKYSISRGWLYSNGYSTDRIRSNDAYKDPPSVHLWNRYTQEACGTKKGTSAGYHRHRRKGTEACDDCRKAHSEHRSQKRKENIKSKRQKETLPLEMGESADSSVIGSDYTDMGHGEVEKTYYADNEYEGLYPIDVEHEYDGYDEPF